MKYYNEIEKMFNEGSSNVEIERALGCDKSTVSHAIKALGLVRTEAQKFEIKRRSQLGKTYAKCSKYKFKQELRVATYESKYYILDHITKGLINTDDLEADIETAVASIQALRAKFAKIPKFTKQEKK
jgi:predicted transcriptional regulator